MSYTKKELELEIHNFRSTLSKLLSAYVESSFGDQFYDITYDQVYKEATDLLKGETTKNISDDIGQLKKIAKLVKLYKRKIDRYRKKSSAALVSDPPLQEADYIEIDRLWEEATAIQDKLFLLIEKYYSE
jgi:hypothetical protein